MKYTSIHIPAPCDKKFDEMIPEGAGKRCTACDTVVVDFSSMSDAELLQHLRSGKYACGVFHPLQFMKLFPEENKINKKRIYWSRIAASIAAGILPFTLALAQTQPSQRNFVTRDRLELKGGIDKEEIKTENNKLHKVKLVALTRQSHTPLEAIIFIRELGIQSIYTNALGELELTIPDSLKKSTLTIEAIVYEYKRIKIHIKASQLIKAGKKTLYFKQKIYPKKDSYVVGRWVWVETSENKTSI